MREWVSDTAVRVPSPACWRESAGSGVASWFGASRIAQMSMQTIDATELLSTPPPAFGHLPRFAEKEKPL